MFVEHRAFGERPQPAPRKEIPSSKGYPAVRDPAAENPQGSLRADLGKASLRRMRQHYDPACSI